MFLFLSCELCNTLVNSNVSVTSLTQITKVKWKLLECWPSDVRVFTKLPKLSVAEAWVGWSVLSVTFEDACPCCKMKTAWATSIEVGRYILHGMHWVEVRRSRLQGYQVQTVSVVSGGCACRYNCLVFLVSDGLRTFAGLWISHK